MFTLFQCHNYASTMLSAFGHSERVMHFKRFEENHILHGEVSCSRSRAWDERCHYNSIVNLIGHTSYVAKRPQSAPWFVVGLKDINASFHEGITKGRTYY